LMSLNFVDFFAFFRCSWWVFVFFLFFGILLVYLICACASNNYALLVKKKRMILRHALILWRLRIGSNTQDKLYAYGILLEGFFLRGIFVILYKFHKKVDQISTKLEGLINLRIGDKLKELKIETRD
jgi:hypothetical protein